jgi:putative ubiquitin-RnfH superfamily antitoxin RatB of RatAB toxin-antitoxin module
MQVEVAYAGPEGQWLVALELDAGATVSEAIERSGIRARLPALPIGDDNVGVFSRSCRLDDALADGDRVEIYRPLLADPKEARRRRAAKR